jgi:hypothetical protein
VIPSLEEMGITVNPAEVDLIKHLQPTATYVMVSEATREMIIVTEDGNHHVYPEREIERLLMKEREQDALERE